MMNTMKSYIAVSARLSYQIDRRIRIHTALNTIVNVPDPLARLTSIQSAQLLTTHTKYSFRRTPKISMMMNTVERTNVTTDRMRRA